jgi:pimeloyl-ACP methyl ester carboxylesterase
MTDRPAADAEAVEFALPWGSIVRGVRWGAGEDFVILLHEPGRDLDAWGDLPRRLAGHLPLAALVIDLPGHGLSDDPWQPERLGDLLDAVDAALPATGRRFLVAAGESGLAGIERAASLEFDGLVCLSPEPPANGERPARSPSVPKQFFAAALAGDDLNGARTLAARCGGWAVVTSVPVAERGTALLSTTWRDRIDNQIATFLHDCLNACPMRPMGS